MNISTSKRKIGFLCNKHLLSLLFVLILIINIVAVVYLSRFKDELHIDEYYSYILSNSYDVAKIKFDSTVWDSWISGKDYMRFVTVQPGEGFAYASVYRNNSMDAHPPLYYFLLHTVCSFFPNSFSKVYGIALNLIFFILTQCVLFVLSKKILGNNFWAVLPCAVYGGTMIGQDTVMFIRMYAMITFFTLLLLYLHYRMICEHKHSYFTLCGIVSFLGIFTHYYAAVAAFYFAAFTCFFLLWKKQYKLLFQYATAMLLSVILVFILYPAGLSQITGSDTNNVGNEVAAHISDFSGIHAASLDMFMQMISASLSGIRRILFPSVCILCTAFFFSFLISASGEPGGINGKRRITVLSVLLLIFILGLYTVSHISGKYNYVRYLYHFFPILLLFSVLVLKALLDYLPINSRVIALGLICVFVLNCVSLSLHKQSSYRMAKDYRTCSAISRKYSDYPLIILNNDSNPVLTANFGIISKFDKVYITNWNKEETSIEEILISSGSDDGFVFMAPYKSDWSEGFDSTTVREHILETTHLKNAQKISQYRLVNIYFAE